MMRSARTRWILCGLLLALPLGASEPSFNKVRDCLSRRYHAQPVSGMGFLGAVARCFTPSGVHGLRMAVIDEAPEAQSLDEDFDRQLREAVDPSYAPFVRVVSKHERVLIYLREAGRHFELLLVSAEPREAVVMAMRLDPEALQQWMDDPEGMSRKSTHTCGK
jgi:hypothetical protein